MKNCDLSWVGLVFVVLLLVVVFLVVVISVILFVVGDLVWMIWKILVMGGLFGVMLRNFMIMVNFGIIYYLLVIVVVIGFCMNLFNIGVDG